MPVPVGRRLRANKALELTAVPASGNVAVFHNCTGVAVVQFTVGGSSAGTFGPFATIQTSRVNHDRCCITYLRHMLSYHHG